MKTYALPTLTRWFFCFFLLLHTSLSVSSLAQTVTQSYTTTGYYSYTVPAGGPFSVTLTTKGGDGADGGSYYINPGGSGSKMVSTTTIQSGDQLIFIVGESGYNMKNGGAGGGGGGTAIVLNQGNILTLLMASGGGGGGSLDRDELGGGGQGLGGPAGGLGGNQENAPYTIGGGGGGGFAGPGTDGIAGANSYYPGRGGGQARLTAISPGGIERTGNRNGGQGFGGGGSAHTYGSSGGGGGGYGGGNGSPSTSQSNSRAQGGYSYGNGTITLGVDGGGTQADGFATIQFAANSIKATLKSTPITSCLGQTVSIPGSITATGNWTLQLSDGATVSGTNSGTFAVAVSPTLSTTYTITSAAYANSLAQPANLTGSTIVKIVAPANRLYVKANATGANTGSSWTDAFTNLQDALNYGCTSALTEIWVARGTYKPGTTRAASFAMLPGVKIYGGFEGAESDLSQRPAIDPMNGAPSSSTLSGDLGQAGRAYHVVYNPSSLSLTASAQLDGFVITGGNANGQLDNQYYGGGMYNDGNGSGKFCSPTIANCLFVNNQTSAFGGAIYNGGTLGGLASPTLINCAFVSNTAQMGGAIYNDGVQGVSSPRITNCFFGNNQVSAFGGALYNEGRSGNSSPALVNCGFLNNSAGTGNGGALSNSGAFGVCLPTFTNCSFQGNTANLGALMINSGVDGNCTPQLTNCIIFNQGGSNAIYNSFSSASLLYSLVEPTVTGYTTDPSNLTVTSNPFSSTTSLTLNACTPAINAGLSSASGINGITTDLANNARIVGAAVDMGAYEFQGDPSFPIAFTQQPPSASAVCAGSALRIPTSLTGSEPITYQWFKNGASLGSAQIASTLSLTSLQTTDAGSYSLVAIGVCNSLTSSTFSLTVNTITAAILNPGPGSLTLSCGSSTVSLTATGGTTYQWDDASTQPVRVFSQASSYSVIVSSALGCSATASVTVFFRNTLNPSAMTFTPMAPVGSVINLTASGGNAYQWTSPTSASFTTANSNANISARLLAAGPQTFTVVVTLGACQQTRTVSVTATNGPDLSPIIYLPDANFSPGPSAKQFLVRVYEVGWLPTAPSSITITLTAPSGYSMSFDASQTSINVSGGDANPVTVNNSDWEIINTIDNQQLTLRARSGVYIRGGSQSVLGLTLVRTTANTGSVSNLTVNVANDSSGQYDRLSTNNIYARILNGL